MADLQALQKNLTARGYAFSYFETAAQAADYLDGSLDGQEIGFGGSVTLRDMGLYERLGAHNNVHWHWMNRDSMALAQAAPVYISSVNGLSETGEIINIDGGGNRLASLQYGHKHIYLVVGINKLRPTFEEALWRARNIASPKNAQRLGSKTPCAAKGDKCYDCKVPGRICRSLNVLWHGTFETGSVEVVLVNEALGF